MLLFEVGFVGDREAAPVVLTALRKLEYRGYDSAGLATITDSRIWLKKDVGKLAEVEQKHSLAKLPGEVGIGHVRWATHGDVTQLNAHPHHDCHHKIAIVHNGIIENYQELRRRLESRHKFVSNTDTEVIPHLIEERMEEGASLEGDEGPRDGKAEPGHHLRLLGYPLPHVRERSGLQDLDLHQLQV